MKKNILFILALCGLSFSGYLSGVKFFGGTCAFNETCATFLGYPTCYYGFLLFLGITLFTLFNVLGKLSRERMLSLVLGIAALGILFSGYFSFREFGKVLDEGIRAYVLGLPTCAYGFVFFAIIFFVALSQKRASV